MQGSAADWLEEGNILYLSAKYNESIRAYNKAIELDPSLIWAWNNKGLAFNSQNKYDEANAAFAEASYNKGISRYSLGKYDKAIILMTMP